MNYSKINNIFGWVAFVIAALTYILTLEPSASFWDCGEFIACIYRLQVAHQPGAPLFTMIGKVFTLLSMGNNNKVAYWANMASALASGATIMFLFWTVTALAKKILVKTAEDLNIGNLIIIIGSGLVGALAYAWSDTFWFSAVESEVYAQSSLCTAIVFWAILKWDAHADEPHANRWIVFIAYIMGLSIGIHLLNLLVIPAIALVIYFRKAQKVSAQGTILAFLAGVVSVAFVLWGVIQFTVKGAAYSDLLFVNTLGMGFGSGAIAFFVLMIATIGAGIYFTISQSKVAVIVSAICFVLALGISTGIIGVVVGIVLLAVLEYALKIREKRFALNSFFVCLLFILFGYSSFVMIVVRAKADPNLNNSDPQDAFALNSYLNRDQYGDTPLLYGQFFDSTPTDQTEGATIYRRGKERYEVAGKKLTTVYDRNTLFPRMFSDKAGHPQFYKAWSKLGQDEKPTFGTNLGFFATWQINQMYTRYFLWNFVGRTNDLDGQTSNSGADGNWISGWNFKKPLPSAVTDSKSYNRLYFLPLIVGLVGLFFHFKKDQQNAGVVLVLFFFTGLAIVLYLNQDPLQPRERDYAYAGSFYAFAIWIGLGVIGIADILRKKLDVKTSGIIASVVCLLVAPILMASQEWDDHDRSTKLTPHDMAYNYLNSCAPNAILFTYADNDTYPLWYIQEVENVRPDVRIVNLSLLGTDWYIRGMKHKMNQSEPLPITMPDDKFKAGVRDVIYLNDQKLPGNSELKEVFDFITSDEKEAMVQYNNGDLGNYLPTKNFKITVNANDVLQSGTVPASQKDKIVPEMDWTFGGRYVTKDVLAMMDILAHNNWKRPVYFATTVPDENLIGLGKYLYSEGFANRLLPLKPDTASKADLTNTPVMYNNMMNKFKWGNMKNATYLDHESYTMFYPLISRLYSTLADNLLKEGHPDLAKNALKKYDDVMPNNIPNTEIAIRKYYLIETAYRLGETEMANKLANTVYNYVTNMLDYNYTLLQNNEVSIESRDIQYSMSMLNGLVEFTHDFKQPELNAKFDKQFKAYEQKLGMGGK
ncbi:glycosyltransferase family 117 protein [Mucilaginibacter flavus]|uniref:glycosyltransferase family 117 protein n=1 Tax=Mucilaginibacter flavus TaxID=931504 RepID=UPI0025B3DC53|nr:DUF2723 domain-containing protein [Mucilaginibacter flavus]MDN3580452.1 DUF2723 domain-containing protein [Mucilaginibacter flavus]